MLKKYALEFKICHIWNIPSLLKADIQKMLKDLCPLPFFTNSLKPQTKLSFIRYEYQCKCGLQVLRVRLNKITFKNMIMKINLYFIDENRFYTIYQSHWHSEDST